MDDVAERATPLVSGSVIRLTGRRRAIRVVRSTVDV
jgi:hypothetical protein